MFFHKRRVIKAICGGLILCLLLSVWGVYGQAAEVREDVVRLHILANSDSTADQTLKLQVRDAITRAAADWAAADPAAARELARDELPRLQAVAQQTVRDAGCNHPVAVEMTRMYFTTRQYGAVTLPAGMYDAVRVTIGAGAGQNWWCVVYPPMCVGGAADGDAPAQMPDMLTGDGERYILRFKLVEWIESFLQLFR